MCTSGWKKDKNISFFFFFLNVICHPADDWWLTTHVVFWCWFWCWSMLIFPSRQIMLFFPAGWSSVTSRMFVLKAKGRKSWKQSGRGSNCFLSGSSTDLLCVWRVLEISKAFQQKRLIECCDMKIDSYHIMYWILVLLINILSSTVSVLLQTVGLQQLIT